MAGSVKAAGFWSYVHADDEHEGGRIVRLRERLERSIRFYSGIRDFCIFLDRKDIGWGQKWAERIAASLDGAFLLFPVVTPSYFSSGPCREEVLAFQERETKLGRGDLILPIYYLASDLMDSVGQPTFSAEERRIGELLSSLQYEDWRTLRLTEETDKSYGNAIERLAQLAAKTIRTTVTHADGTPRAVAPTKPLAKTSGPPATEQRADHETSSPQAIAETSPAVLNTAPGHVMSLTVNQMPGRGDFATIGEAIARAPGGAKILVAPGRYRESVVIDKPLELVGDGPRDDIVIDASDAAALIFDTNIGIVRNFTLRQSNKNSKNYCVLIKQGRLELEGCDISSAALSCLMVIDSADPRVRNNRIHGGNQSGILIKGARGTFEDNEIFANGLAEISVGHAASDPIVRRNRIYDGKQGGLFIYEGAGGTFEDNDLFSNALTGIQVIEAAEPIVRRNRIHDTSGSGVSIFSGARGTFEENDIFGNALVGIEVREASNPIVRRNQIHNNKQSGIYVQTEGRGLFEDNDILDNAFAGISVSKKGDPTVRNNRINRNGYEAIWVREESAGTFMDNDLTKNTRGAWDVDASSEPRVKREKNREK